MRSRSSTMNPTNVHGGINISECDRDKRRKTRRDANFHQFVCLVVTTTIFNAIIMASIIINSFTLAMETTSLRMSIPLFFIYTDAIFVGIFVLEFSFKLYAQPIGYWKSYYNLLDFTVLCFALIYQIISGLELQGNAVIFLRIAAGCRALRILRFISLIKGLQTLITALIQAFHSSVFYLLLLLFIIMFLFGILGYYFFGYDERGDKRNWGNFGVSLLSLFAYVTADGWTDIQYQLNSHGYSGSEVFTIIFLFLGHFIFTNLFIGVIITNIHSAAKNYRDQEIKEKKKFIQDKKEIMIKKQHGDVVQLLETQRASNFTNFQEMTRDFQETLRHDDFMYSSDLCTNTLWMETMVGSLNHLKNSKHRIQQLHFEMAETLAQLKEQQLQREEVDDTVY